MYGIFNAEPYRGVPLMQSTNTRISLRGLPGRVSDTSARALREQFLAGEVDIEDFLKTNAWKFPRTREARFENQVQTYATASIVINQFWEYLQKQPVSELMSLLRKKCDSDSYHARVHAFSEYCDGALSFLQNRFIDDVRKKHREQERSQDFELQICFFSVARKRYPNLKGLPFPSPKDLVTLLVRMADVAPRVFARDMGREATRDELLAILRHPSMLHFFVEIMSNDRKATHPLFALLEGQRRANLNDLSRTFDPRFFEIATSGDSAFLVLKQSVIDQHHRKHLKAAERRTRRRQPPRPVLGCPALYTGKIRDMYTWTLSLLEGWI